MRDGGDKRGPVHKHAQAGIQGSVEQGPWWCGMEGRGSTRPRSRTLGAAKSLGLCTNATGRHLTTLATRLSGAQPATVRLRMRVSEVVSYCSPRRGGTLKLQIISATHDGQGLVKAYGRLAMAMRVPAGERQRIRVDSSPFSRHLLPSLELFR